MVAFAYLQGGLLHGWTAGVPHAKTSALVFRDRNDKQDENNRYKRACPRSSASFSPGIWGAKRENPTLEGNSVHTIFRRDHPPPSSSWFSSLPIIHQESPSEPSPQCCTSGVGQSRGLGKVQLYRITNLDMAIMSYVEMMKRMTFTIGSVVLFCGDLPQLHCSRWRSALCYSHSLPSSIILIFVFCSSLSYQWSGGQWWIMCQVAIDFQ